MCRTAYLRPATVRRVFVAGLSAGALLALDARRCGVNGVGVMSPSFVYDGWNKLWCIPFFSSQ